MTPALKVYVKVWCPWCVMARDWLDHHGYRYEWIDVEKTRSDYDEMIRISGQRRTPTLVTADGKVLPDFGPDELAVFLKENSIAP